MDVGDFLKQSIEEYLFKDLQNISNISVPKGEVGEGSYPMLASILAGIELLGTLVNPRGSITVTSGKKEIEGNRHFTHFWLNYLSEYDKKYKGFEKLFYDLLRNGIVHTFMVKQNIVVFKNHKKHMACSKKPPLLIVGCDQFFKDFRQTYERYIQSILKSGTTKTGVDRNKMQANLDEILQLYSDQSDKQFSSEYTPETSTGIILGKVITSGASLSPIDIDELINAGGTTTPSGINLTRGG